MTSSHICGTRLSKRIIDMFFELASCSKFDPLRERGLSVLKPIGEVFRVVSAGANFPRNWTPLDPPTFRLDHKIVRLSLVTHHFCKHCEAPGDLGDVLELDEVCLFEDVFLRHAMLPKVLPQKFHPFPTRTQILHWVRKTVNYSGDPRLVTKNTPLHNLRRPASCLWRTHALSFSSQLLLSKHIIRVYAVYTMFVQLILAGNTDIFTSGYVGEQIQMLKGEFSEIWRAESLSMQTRGGILLVASDTWVCYW